MGQLGKQLYGCKVIGSCGGPAKCKSIVDGYGFDVAIDRKTLPEKDADGNWDARKEELKKRLKEAAPNGIDMYFDNVGQDHFEAAYETLGTGGRIAICGGIAGYNDAQAPKERIKPTTTIYTFQRIEGFMCMPWLSGKKGSFLSDMAGWLKEGKIKPKEVPLSPPVPPFPGRPSLRPCPSLPFPPPLPFPSLSSFPPLIPSRILSL